MALITCKDCKKAFSTDAKRCPHCGAKKPVERWSGTTILMILLGVFVLGGLSSHEHRKTPEEEARAAESQKERVMGDVCQNEIKKILHDADSAEFDDSLTYRVSKDGDVYNILVTLRAKNGFNALRKMAVMCKVVTDDSGNWHVSSVKEIK